jgi:hypothetical protein
LWPWVVASALVALGLRTSPTFRIRLGRASSVLCLGAVLSVVMWTGEFNYDQSYRSDAARRQTLQECLLGILQRLDGSTCIHYNLQLGIEPVIYGSSIHASFARYLPMLAGSTHGPVLVRFEGITSDSIQMQGIDTVILNGGDVAMVASDDSAIIFRADVGSMRGCEALQLNADIRGGGEGTSQVFVHDLSNTGGVGSLQSVTLPVEETADWQHKVFTFGSLTGFHPVVRYQPVSEPGTFWLRDVTISCRLDRAM